MKKGQVTFFILIGIVILFAVGFIFFLLIGSVSNKGQQQNQLVLEEVLAKTNVQQRMELCLLQAVNEGVQLIAGQAGFVIDQQQVSTPYGTLTLAGTNLGDRALLQQGTPRVALVKAPALTDYTEKTDAQFNTGSNAFFMTPYYPCMSVTRGSPLLGISSLECSTDVNLDEDVCVQDCRRLYQLSTLMKPRRVDAGQESVKTAFSDRIDLPPVCKQSYPEGCEVTGTCDCTCVEGCENSMQTRLEEFVEQYYPLCLEAAEFPGYSVALTSFSLDTLFTKRTFDVSLQQQVEVNASTIKTQLDFPVIHAKQVPWKMISLAHELEKEFLLQDETHPAYDLAEGITTSSTFTSTTIEKEYVRFNNKLYNLIHIRMEGEDGNVDGRPLVFSFARENRIPVLEGIPPLFPSMVSGTLFDVTACGADPDEDLLVYDFTIDSNWKPSFVSSTTQLSGGILVECAVARFTLPSPTFRGLTRPLTVTVKENVPGADPSNPRTFDFQTTPVKIPN